MILLVCSIGYAQKSKKKGSAAAPAKASKSFDRMQHYRQIYASAVKYNDFAVATQALYEMIAISPNSKGLKDTLSQVYFQRAAWPQVVLLTMEILEDDPNNDGALELQAIANQSLGRIKESLASYEKLYQSTQSPFHLYEIAALQYSMRRFGECEQSIKKLASDPATQDKKITISMQTGESQEVPISAAVMNLQGVVDLDQGNKEDAKIAFESAIKLFPEFQLAKNNLAEVMK